MRSLAAKIGLAAVLLSAVVTGGMAAARQVAVFNDSDFAMVQLQARLPKAKAWPFELLGKYSLGVGRTAKASLPAGSACVYDLLATFDDGRKQQKLAVNVCKSATIKFTGP